MSDDPNHKQPSSDSREEYVLPERFKVSKSTILVDQFMNRFILIGGLGVIVAVFGIFFFILGVVIPLFGSAKIDFAKEIQTDLQQPLLIGTDEWAEKPFVIEQSGFLHFYDSQKGERIETIDLNLPEETQITAHFYLQDLQMVFLGLSDGRLLELTLAFKPTFDPNGARIIQPLMAGRRILTLQNNKGQITSIDAEIESGKKTIALITENEDGTNLVYQAYTRKRTLFGEGDFQLATEETLLSSSISNSQPVSVLVGSRAARIITRLSDGNIALFNWNGSNFTQSQTFQPFPDENVASMDFIQGKNTLSLVSTSGLHVAYNLFRSPSSGQLQFAQIKEFKPILGDPQFFARSSRNKAFLIGTEEALTFRYLTTGKVRWEQENKSGISQAVINRKFDKIIALNANNAIEIYNLNDPHPEAGIPAFFSKIWYEGQSEPDYVWQSTGGSDDFEPKLSLIPLIFGSLKGTLYALLFSVPIALLAAVYTSQFLNPDLKKIIKPTMEIMASLPSVVLGFLGALWLAPILEWQMPSLILTLTAIPLTAIAIGFFWNKLPIQYRRLIPAGWEFFVFVPTLIIVSYFVWQLGPAFEKVVFRTTDPSTGQSIADFRLWWESMTGNQFQQRNSLVVGFMMGFAVIPIIYTIAEDAMSAVPKSLTSGSLALGASRWQTAARVVLPTAFAGIFSALMIGFGRAVGETMIVVMATGNTPIMELDIFNGMRTLSANIAVELPEAPHNGTLYRTLFLGAFVLFLMTFFVNTVAEIMRARIRDRFKVVS